MPGMHPFLADEFHVRWSTLVPEAVESDIRKGLADAREAIEGICAQDLENLSYEGTYGALEEATRGLDRGWGRLQHLDSVCDEPKQREALNAMLPEVSEFYASIPLNERLWQVLKTFGTSQAMPGLDEVRRRFVEETMAGFVESGADLPPELKARVAEIEAELSKLKSRTRKSWPACRTARGPRPWRMRGRGVWRATRSRCGGSRCNSRR
jgi:oligopeptidase A